jgi:diguanylate cyclase (GGDEF)-like protein
MAKTRESNLALSNRYKRVTTAVGIAVVVLSVIASVYIDSVKDDSSKSLQQLNELNQISEKTLQQLVLSQLELDTLMLSGTRGSEQPITEALKQAFRFSQELNELAMQQPSSFQEQSVALNTQLISYQKLVLELLENSKELDWMYPALPFINGSMLSDNQDFETAVTQAITELHEEEKQIYRKDSFRLFYAANDLWRRIILNFRAMMIRFSGLQNVPMEASAEEVNVNLLLSELRRRLAELEVFRAEGQLSFQGDDSLTIMQQALESWAIGFEKLRNMRLSVYWRADVEFLNTRIEPLQREILNTIAAIKKEILHFSEQKTSEVEQAINALILQLWVIAILIILVLIIGYRYMQRLILQPIRRVAEALWAESQGKTSTNLAASSASEINQLVEAFSAMRKQVNDRQQALEHQAFHDSLTSLPNRVLLSERLEYHISLAQRNQAPLALLMMDLNGFKEINDTLGHQVGDLVLIHVSQRLHKDVRRTDTVARMGGDEFAILLPDTGIDEAKMQAAKLSRSLESSFEIAGHRLHVSASIGITLHPNDGHTAKIMIQRADVAMYVAKRSHQQYVFYDRKLDSHNIGWLTLPADLELALRENQLELHYQPKVNLQTQDVEGFEALLRWQHPRHGWVNPEDIVELAESSGMIQALTVWVVENAVERCAAWWKAGLQLNMAVNLSPHNLHDTHLYEVVCGLLEHYDLPGEVLTLEITENAFISDPTQVVTLIHRFRAMGVRIAIDDYGTGFSSLSYLRQLSANELKIDKVFVMNLHNSQEDLIIVRSTIHMAQNLGLNVVAEGIENETVMGIMTELGADSAQGYHISKPMPASLVEKWIVNWQGKHDTANSDTSV